MAATAHRMARHRGKRVTHLTLHMVRKIILTREENADRVIEAINASKETAITVVAPRNSALADREGLARIGELAAEKGMSVAIESVDEELLGLAHAAHLETVHPFFRADRRHLALDGIVKNPVQHPRVPVHVEESETQEEEVVEEPEEIVEEPKTHRAVHVAQHPVPPHNHPLPTPVASRPSLEAEEPRTVEDRPRRRVSWFRMAVALVVIAALVGGIGEMFFRSGSVSLTLAETSWEYSGKITAATSITTSTAGQLAIRGQLFEGPKNVAQAFPATGEPGTTSTPSTAKPRVTVYNESLDAETFVVKTRFQGKSGLFRAATAVAIPAAKKEGDKLTPGTATVEVIPDSATILDSATDKEKLTVPGLDGTPKASLFYAILAKPAAPTTAPAQATTPPASRVVTASDEETAKSQINGVLIAAFRASLIAAQPQGLTLIDGAIQVEPQQLTVNKDVDASGNFNLVGQATLRGLAFSDSDLKALMLSQAITQTGINYPVEFRKIDLSYNDVQADLKNGRMTFTVNVKATLVGKATEDEVRNAVVGKSKATAAEWIKGQGMFAEGKVSVSPLWRFALPAEPTKVKVEVK